MSTHGDEDALRRQQRHFLHDVEHELRTINRRTIHARIPALDRESFIRVATMVAELRSDWLQTTLELSRLAHDAPERTALLVQLRERRIAFEEARDAFAALERTIEQGYVDIGG